jgi:hypothetical protein
MNPWSPGFDLGLDTERFTSAIGRGSGSTSWGSKLKSGMDPLTFGLGIAGIGSSLFGGLLGQQSTASAMQAQLAAADAKRLSDVQVARDTAKAQMGMGMWGPLYQSTTGSDIEEARQRRAIGTAFSELAPKETALMSERSRRERLARISPESKEASMFENLLNMKRTGFQQAAQMEGMFGPTSFSRRFTNI